MGHRRLAALDPDHRAVAHGAREQQCQRPGPAVEVEHGLAAFEARGLEGGRVERLGLAAVGLQEGVRRDLELEAQQPLDDGGAAAQDALLLAEGDVGPRAVEEQRHRAHLAPEPHDLARPRLEPGDLVRGGDQVDRALLRRRQVTHGEVADHPVVMARMVGLPALRLGEALGEADDLDRPLARQQAGLEREHPVERAALVETQPRRAVRLAMEAELHLVAVMPGLGGRRDRLDRGLGDAAQVDQGLAHLPLLEPALGGVVQLLEPAAAALGHVRARRRDAVGTAREEPSQPCLGEVASNA